MESKQELLQIVKKRFLGRRIRYFIVNNNHNRRNGTAISISSIIGDSINAWSNYNEDHNREMFIAFGVIPDDKNSVFASFNPYKYNGNVDNEERALDTDVFFQLLGRGEGPQNDPLKMITFTDSNDGAFSVSCKCLIMYTPN